jgi:aminopeptidase N
MTKKATFVFQRSDFRPRPAKMEHMDVWLGFYEDRVEAANAIRLTAREALSEVVLDARDMEIRKCEWIAGGGARTPLSWAWDGEKRKLRIRLPSEVKPGTAFTIGTAVTVKPSDNILEGIYKDTTPHGCPQQYMSQCQQYGFERILPVYDDCSAKCTFTTTLEGDARYTHMVSNGDISRTLNPNGRPVPKPGERSRKVITYENRRPMAPYLFIACAGTWDVLKDEVIYPSGQRVALEYLVPPGRKAGAAMPMKILKESMLWQGRTQEFRYPYEVYRTICMEKSYYGGMENVGNTTIVTDAALIDENTNDRRLEYAHGVIVHEFEHSQCGSDVTMETPFDIWLNEAFTVDVERQFASTLFHPVCVRLDNVDVIRAPLGGPLTVEDAGRTGNIVRKGFNDPKDLIDGVTYTKGAEVIRMLRLILGPKVFRRAKNLYFRRYSGGNADTHKFLACFEEVSGRDLTQFKGEWLYTIGYPRVEAAWKFDAKRRLLTIRFTQSRSGRGGPFHFPVQLAAVNSKGHDIRGTSRVVEINRRSATVSIPCSVEPAFVSLNRDYSFYGTFRVKGETPGLLARQIACDPNLFNRVEALRRLTDRERIRLIRKPDARVGAGWLQVFGQILRDRSLHPAVKSYMLRIDELSMDRRYVPFYRERYAARMRLMKAVAEAHLPDLLVVFAEVDTYRRAKDPRVGLDERRLKAALLRLIVESRSPEAMQAAEEHFHKAWHISDKLAALACINASEHPRRKALMQEGYELWKNHLSSYTSYLGVVSGGVHKDVFSMIAEEERRPGFKIEHPTHSRSLYMSMAGNNGMLWTDAGLRWMADTVVKMASVNEMIAGRMVECFQLVHKLDPALKRKVLRTLRDMKKRLKGVKAPGVTGRVSSYLDSCR